MAAWERLVTKRCRVKHVDAIAGPRMAIAIFYAVWRPSNLVRRTESVISDLGGITEEKIVFRVPCLTR